MWYTFIFMAEDKEDETRQFFGAFIEDADEQAKEWADRNGYTDWYLVPTQQAAWNYSKEIEEAMT